ncbi:MAG: flagellar protein FliS [Chloroflexi bacterium]|nr:flagellar protein FliS [Chloroflexota bacterium]
MYARQNIGKTYREHQVETASPVERLLIVYDFAILACTRRDLERLSRALGVLIEGLDFNYPEVANRMLAIYQWCGEVGRKKEFDEAAQVLNELRSAWAAVAQRERSIPVGMPVAAGAYAEARLSVSG